MTTMQCPALDTVEFAVGDTVTFMPYELTLKAVVRAVLPDHSGDGRVVYHLTTNFSNQVIDGHRVTQYPVLTYTSGLCIVESAFFGTHIWNP